MKKISLALCAFFLIHLNIYGAQPQYNFQRINTSRGLSNNTVIAIIQDNKGFIWIGTDDGLNRFDGSTFKQFKPQPKNANSLRHNITKVIFEDSKGKIWIGTDGGGLSMYDPELESFTNYFNSPTNSNSLSHDNISAITEDKEGNIWVGTYGGGLNMLLPDKTGFKIFKNLSDNSQGICSNYINCLYTDHNGYIWIGSWAKGADRLNPRTGVFTNYQNQYGNPNSISSNTVNCFFEDSQKKLWVGTWQGGLSLYQENKGTFLQIPLSIATSNNSLKPVIRSIVEDHQKNLWLGTYGDGLLKYNPTSKKTSSIVNEPENPYSLSNNNIWSMCFSKDHILWIGTIEGGLNRLDLNKSKFIQITNTIRNYNPLKPILITSLTETHNREIIAGTRENGFSIFNKDISDLQNNIDKSYAPSLPSNNINSIIEDKYGKLWIGTQDGLCTWDKSSKQFKNYSQSPYSINSLSINNISQIFEDHLGTIWVCTWGGGLNKFNREKDNFDHYLAAPKRKVTFLVDMTGQKISDKGVYISGFMNGWSPSETKLNKIENEIYGSTLDLYAGRMEYKFLNGNRWGTEEIVPKECAENNNRVIYIGNQDITLDAVLFGKGCNKIATQPLNTASSANSDNLSSNHIYCICEDRSGTLWIGTNNGMNKFIRDKDTFKSYKHKMDDANSISDNHVNCIYEDLSGNLWIGTLGGGLNSFDREKESFTSYTESEGLINNMVKGLLEDNSGNLWISTSNGISKLNLKTKEFVNYDTNNGLQESFFHNGACLKRNNGQLLFGSADGITMLQPDSFETTLTNGNVIITDLQIFYKSVPVGEMPDGRVILEKSIQYTKNISLSYKDNIITFHFTTLQYASPDRNRFAYKLEGFDKEWHYTDTRNSSATYTNLDGGRYKFLVKTLNNEGIWSSEPTSIRLIISPPFYKSPYFIIALIIALALSAYVWYKKRIKARERRLISEKILAEKKVIELEKENLKNEVDHKNTELASLTMYMSNKAQIITEQIGHLENIAIQSDKNTREKLERLIAKLQEDTDLEKDWEYFELHFDKVHQNFIANLKEKFPELSASEIRLVAYIRMGMSTKEIADITNKTIRGVESSRYRLRQNLNLDTGDNLTDFLFKL